MRFTTLQAAGEATHHQKVLHWWDHHYHQKTLHAGAWRCYCRDHHVELFAGSMNTSMRSKPDTKSTRGSLLSKLLSPRACFSRSSKSSPAT